MITEIELGRGYIQSLQRDLGTVLDCVWRLAAVLLLMGAHPLVIGASPREISFSQSAQSVDAYDFVEMNLKLVSPDAKNPFTDVSVDGEFGITGKDNRLSVDGFCDSADGTVFHVRFMPMSPGDYSYTVNYRQGNFAKSYSGTFRAVNGNRRGVVRADPQHPRHFIWAGTGEHYFWNGTTAYWLMGWRDDEFIRKSIDRLHGLKINRIRVLLTGRSDHFWSEPIQPNGDFTMCLNAWPAERPEDVSNPGYDYTRYNLPHWTKYERMLAHARQEDMIISVVMDIGDSKVRPLDSSEDERRYFRYGAARLAAFSNIMWDLGNGFDWYHQKPVEWGNMMGTAMKKWDPYGHLASAHAESASMVFRTSEWFGMTLFQWWNRPVHAWMLDQRLEQAKTGRIIPQVNEEYGYEDHYPKWSPNYPEGQSAEANRQAAWEIYMAGCYQTTGETAKRGTGAWPDTGGGWVNGRGDDSMVMLKGYIRIVDFFASFDWWKTDPHDELVNNGAYCLVDPGKVYAVYLPAGSDVSVKLQPGRYQAKWFNPRIYWPGGDRRQTIVLSEAEGPVWTSPKAPDSGDWALLLKRN